MNEASCNNTAGTIFNKLHDLLHDLSDIYEWTVLLRTREVRKIFVQEKCKELQEIYVLKSNLRNYFP